MKPQDVLYRTCELYISDNESLVGPVIYNKIHGWLRSKSLHNLCDATSLFDPTLYTGHVLRVLLQVEAFFKKNCIFSEETRCTQAAIESFDSAEWKCAETNRRLEDWEDSIHYQHILRMQEIISTALGDIDDFLVGIPSHWKVTAGATRSMSRKNSFPNVRLTLTPEASPLAAEIIKRWGEERGYRIKPKVTFFNRVEFVPKNWKTHRSIACEPEGNLLLQSGFDGYMRGRLRRHLGVNLSDQFRNQELARIGSIDGQLATIDLSAASDTLSLNAVHLLLPEKWSKFLIGISSRLYERKCGNLSERMRYHKFASMGNGTTFPVESLVFAAACYAIGCTRELTAVYGDDIIVPVDKVHYLVSLLAYLGFDVNLDKSHFEGHYRESCGAHYYQGEEITPRYVRDLDKRKPILAMYINDIVAVSNPYGKVWKQAKELTSAWNLHLVPYVEDKCAGVHIHVFHAYARGLIKYNPKKAWQYGDTSFVGYLALSKPKKFWDMRSYVLWFIRKNSHLLQDRVVESSRYSFGTSKFKTGRVGYFVPTGGPEHIYMWSEYFCASAQ